MRLLYTYLGMLLTFICLDLLWLGIIAKNFYQKNIGYLLAEQVNWWAAAIFYLIFLLGILVFVVAPGKQWTLLKVIIYGAFFGLVTYAAYDLTNLATVKQWPVIVTVVDMIWGAVLCACISVVGWFII